MVFTQIYRHIYELNNYSGDLQNARAFPWPNRMFSINTQAETQQDY